MTSTVHPALPQRFRFGVSTASYQIEGGASEDGKGHSIWDTFTREPANIVDGSNGDITADHFHRYREDFALLKELGADGYRMSLAWTRIQPTGAGAPNSKGLDFYEKLIDCVLEAGATPMVTLYHWDLPQALEDAGGWLNRDTADRFAEYAEIAADRFADRVQHWVPVNEPNVAMHTGYATTDFAPGRGLGLDALPVAHHLLLAHGRAVSVLRQHGAASVGTATSHCPIWTIDNQSDDDAAAVKFYDAYWNRLFLDPILLGSYPAQLMPLLESAIKPGDLETIHQKLDFYGVNY